MASKRRIRRKECGDKHRHATRAEAVSHLVSLRKSGRVSGDIHAYRCPWGDHWHVGHSGNRPKWIGGIRVA